MQSMAKMTTIRVSSSSIFARKALLRLGSIITTPGSSSSMCLFVIHRFVIGKDFQTRDVMVIAQHQSLLTSGYSLTVNMNWFSNYIELRKFLVQRPSLNTFNCHYFDAFIRNWSQLRPVRQSGRH